MREMPHTRNFFVEDLGETENFMKFSEDSSRIIHEMGSIELYDWGQRSRTVH